MSWVVAVPDLGTTANLTNVPGNEIYHVGKIQGENLVGDTKKDIKYIFIHGNTRPGKEK